MSRGLGQIERRILDCLNAEGGYVNTVRLAGLIYGRTPTPSNITYALYALRLLAKDGRVFGVRGRPFIWTTESMILDRKNREQRFRRAKSKIRMRRASDHRFKYRSTGKPTHRDELPGQLEFGRLPWIGQINGW